MASSYGCQIFGKSHVSKNSSQKIVEEIFWNGKVEIFENIIINDNQKLIVEAGTEVVFNGFYNIKVFGSMICNGTPDNRISFSYFNDLFTPDSLHENCWNGILVKSSSENDSTVFKYTDFKYSKSSVTDNLINFLHGGVITIYNSSKISIDGCSFQNNYSLYGGAVSILYDSYPLISNSIFSKNYGEFSGSAIYNFYSYPVLVNNTLVNNFIIDDDQFALNSTVHNFISKLLFTNNIVFNNTYAYKELFEAKEFFTYRNDISEEMEGNISIDPILNSDFSLDADSECINYGDNEILYNFGLYKDFNGNSRIYGDRCDLGALEYSPDEIDENTTKNSSLSFAYPNPFNNSTNIVFHNSVDISLSLRIFNIKGEVIVESLIKNCGIGVVSFECDFSNFTSGIYFYEISNEKAVLTDGKLSFIK
ncbi:MAG: T9SS type A sorting domain-containing protein [Candidatus Delongbacteria bacterium]|nr:T9SS type A sorting domain-containing protein [Candidatus Delongbacteria bacterium]MBN2834539.1 T9SS type A sorting domain-containing protein [Candidatus Delongbacteria bacterium]